MSAVELVSTLTVIFVAAAILLVVAARFSWPAIPFYLLAGFLVSPYIEQGLLLELAHWGIAFLVFAFAVELDPLDWGGLRGDSYLVSILQFLLTGSVMFGVGTLLDLTTVDALFFTIAATLSSSLVALDLLERRIRLRSLHERLAESIHFVEAVIAIVVVLLLSAFVYTDGGVFVIAYGIAFVGLALGIRHVLFDRFAAFAEGDVEILMLTGVSLLIGFIALCELIGMSIVVGAFAAGIAVSSEYPHDVEVLDAISYLEDFFAPVFFITIGALIFVPSMGTLVVVLVLVLGVVVLNPLIIYGLLRWRGYDSRTATLTGFTLDQVSEFSLIIAIEAFAADVLRGDLFDVIVIAAIATMFLSAVSYRYVEGGYQFLVETGILEPDREHIRARSQVPEDIEDHVVVSGYNREGQQIVEAIEETGHSYVVIESDPTREAVVEEHCDNYVFGDAKTESAWEVAGAEEATLLVTTVPRTEWTEHLLSFDIGVDTIVHATDVDSGADLLEQGALFVAIPDLLASDHLGDLVRSILEGEMTSADLHDRGQRRLEKAREYGPSDVRRI